ncbi:mitochondrial 37S ribosomal protein uS4m [Thermothelomyces heterothallicus CBS 202.75]|uniref:mitochondrial 37S ribosomal protein uS4m n=1 Tax=Thermothelomyces heterothallicus CBS 202.75 TaxID=1149848 RepID=UPI003744970D
MRQRRLLRFHGLKRPRVRQTWNKYNLFNLFRLRTPTLQTKTLFQQKWIAKSLTRGYHGEHIKEYKWERMFSRRPLSAVNMDPAYMARYDGSEQAAGRGSGRKARMGSKHVGPKNQGNLDAPTPYMQMVFAPMERRLDIAIFRALFASSARQARQFVLHGFVTVNGKKMRHPGYLLNPGDMFQVDIERVMAATGQPKRGGQNQNASAKAEPAESAQGEEGEEGEGGSGDAAAEGAEAAAEPVDPEAAKAKHLETLNLLKERAKKIMLVKDRYHRAKKKKALRKYLKDLKATMDRARKQRNQSPEEMDEAERELTAILSDLTLSPAEHRARGKKQQQQQRREQETAELKAGLQAATGSTSVSGSTATSLGLLTDTQRAVLKWVIRSEVENPHDPSKPYATPWRPRDFMSAFAFIPRYLEVNQRICAAVYLRHPVARPGLSEVPTPFSPMLSQLAFNWYLKRG